MKTNLLRWFSVIAAGGLLLFLAWAVGANTPQSVAGTKVGLVDIAGAKAAVDKYKSVPVFVPPGPSLDLTPLRGKFVFSVPVSSAIPFLANVLQGEAQAAKTAGVKYKDCPNQGTPPEWGQCITQGIGQKANLISDFGITPALIGPQLLQAKSAGIPVIEAGLDNRGKIPSGFAAIVDQDLVLPGQLMADYSIVYRSGKVNAVVIHTSDFTGDDLLVNAIQAEFKKRCGTSCKVRVIDVPVGDWGTKVQGELQSAIVGDPGVNIAILAYDAMVANGLAGIRGANAADRVKVVTYNGTPSVLKLIGQPGSPVIMNIGQPTFWIGWNDMDQAFRVMLHKAPGKHPANPVRIFDASNRAQLGSNPAPASGYGTSYIAGYKKLWGITK